MRVAPTKQGRKSLLAEAHLAAAAVVRLVEQAKEAERLTDAEAEALAAELRAVVDRIGNVHAKLIAATGRG